MLTPQERDRAIRAIAPTKVEEAALEYEWRSFWGRPKQFAPVGHWLVWLILAGRGWGKTRVGAEWVRERVAQGAKRVSLVARTAADIRDVMVEGESGILAISPPWNRPKYEPSKRRLTWKSGCVATLFTADEPDRLRGPQSDTVWADELAAWRYCQESWDNITFGLRLGAAYGIEPKAIVTTTPRPIATLRSLIDDDATIRTVGSTYENRANLGRAFIRTVLRKYEGTRLGRQELEAEMLDDAPGALWRREEMIEAHRFKLLRNPDGSCESPAELRKRLKPLLRSIVVAVDPATTVSEDSAETGIVVVGIGKTDEGYVLEDATGKYSPGEWAEKVIRLFDDWKADYVVAEVNQGGDLVAANLHTFRESLPIREVHAARGKRTRAEPVASLYEQGRIHHVGAFPLLEDQLCTWEPASGQLSPDRLDALVWGITDLFIENGPPARIRRSKTASSYRMGNDRGFG